MLGCQQQRTGWLSYHYADLGAHAVANQRGADLPKTAARRLSLLHQCIPKRLGDTAPFRMGVLFGRLQPCPLKDMDQFDLRVVSLSNGDGTEHCTLTVLAKVDTNQDRSSCQG
jgi:hypothetical protein